MFIKSLELDGFKTYGQKVKITGFDKSFNAITGCNGTGKSNILDGICFVLGLTSLQHMRVTNLRQLVYKYGQAGVVRARVTIVFDNTDPEYYPLGYENIAEIILTREANCQGRSRYTINGSSVTVKRVHDLFRSVQLNINNPQFLIMQGKITKVLNMRPSELLSMLEETLGTGMYETKRTAALGTLEQRKIVFSRVNDMLNNEIIPLVESFRNEKGEYLKYQQAVDEYEQLCKLMISWEYTQTQSANLKANNDHTSTQKDIIEIENEVHEQSKIIESTQQKIDELEEKKNELSSELDISENSLEERAKEESLYGVKLERREEQLKDDNKKKADLNKKFNMEKELIMEKEMDLKEIKNKDGKLKLIYEQHKQTRDSAIKKLQDASVGLFAVSTEGNSETFTSQLIKIQDVLATAQGAEKVAKSKLAYFMKTFKEKKSEHDNSIGGYKKIKDNCSAREKEVQTLENHIKSLNYNEGIFEELLKERTIAQREYDKIQNEIDEIQAAFPLLMFKYTDPTPHFDRSKVHGLVCDLFKVKDPTAARALEIVAGSRLYNVVVDNEVTGGNLISSGGLKYRYTIIPLNKISGYVIPTAIVNRAKALVGSDKVRTALSLIEYDSSVAKAVEYVFGGLLVCNDMETACILMNSKDINRKCVTLDGEIFDPDGIVSGGSLNIRKELLPKLATMRILEENLKEKQMQVNCIFKRMKKAEADDEEYRNWTNEFNIKASELEYLKKQLEDSNYCHLKNEISSLQLSIDEQNRIIAENSKIIKIKEEESAILKTEMENVETHREEILQKLNSAVDEAQEILNTSEKKYMKSKQECDVLKMEIESLEESCTDYMNELKNLDSEMEVHKNEIILEKSNYEEKKNALAKIMEKVKFQKACLKKCIEGIEKMQKKKSDIKIHQNNLAMDKTNLEYKMKKSKDDADKTKKRIFELLSTYDWIEEQKQFFGVPKSSFDFTDFDPTTVTERCENLKEITEHSKKHVNPNAENTLRQVENTYSLLLSKKEEIANNKLSILQCVRVLDQERKTALQSAYSRVNDELNIILSTLMPETKAELVLHEIDNAMTGVSFKIGFGDIWKESLDELSGGQRSIVALSWILALLSFKPAPIYILDEIDAALDLHHTQNIGKLLNKHFHQSQFIIVSLQEAMFKNANVIFKTMWQDGTSDVIRITQEEGTQQREREPESSNAGRSTQIMESANTVIEVPTTTLILPAVTQTISHSRETSGSHRRGILRPLYDDNKSARGKK